MNGYLLAGDAAPAVVQGEFHHGAHVDVGDIGVLLQTTGEVRLHAAAGVPVPRLAEGHALVQHHPDAHIVGVHRRHGQAHADALHCLVQQGIRVLGDTVGHGQVGLLEFHVFRGLDHHVGKLVSGIVAELIQAAAASLDGDAVACGVLGGDLVLEQGHLRDLDPQAVQQLLGVVVRQDTGLLVRLVEGIQVLVHPADVVGRGVLLHEAGVFIGQHGLAGLVEGSGGMLRHPAAHFRDLQQFCLPLFVPALRGHLLRQISVAVRQVDDGVRHHDLGPVEEGFLQVTGDGVVQLGKSLFRFLLDGADALIDDHPPVHGGLTVAPDSLPVDEDGAVGPQPPHVLRQHQVPPVQHAFVLPVLLHVLQVDLLALVAEVEGIEGAGADGIHFLFDDAGGAVRVQDAAAGLETHAAYQQLVVLDVDLFALALVLVAGGLLDDPGLSFRILEALGDIFGVIHVHVHPRF